MLFPAAISPGSKPEDLSRDEQGYLRLARALLLMWTMAKIAILLTDGYHEDELETLHRRLVMADHKAMILAQANTQLPILSAKGSPLHIDATLDAVDPLEFCAAILPDGRWTEVVDERSKRFLRVLHMAGRPIAALAGGVRLLVAAGIGRGYIFSSEELARGSVEESGPTLPDRTISTYGHVISARSEESLHDLIALFLPAVETFQKQTPATEFLLETRAPE